MSHCYTNNFIIPLNSFDSLHSFFSCFRFGLDGSGALRSAAGGTVIDGSSRYSKGGEFQDGCARSCYKFLDSQVNFDKSELSLLLRALQDNDCEVSERSGGGAEAQRRRKRWPPPLRIVLATLY